MTPDCNDKLDDRLSEMLTEAALSDEKSSFADRAAFQSWLNACEERQNSACRRKIRRAVLAAAAVFACAVLLSGSVLLLSDFLREPEEGLAAPDAGSDIIAEGGNIIIGGDGNGNSGTWAATFASYDDIPEKYRSQVIWFENLPEGYELETVSITRGQQRIEFTSAYSWKKKNVFIVKQVRYYDGTENINIMNGYDDIIEMDGTDIYRKYADGTDTYTFILNDSIVSLLDTESVNTKQIEATIASIKIGWNMR